MAEKNMKKTLKIILLVSLFLIPSGTLRAHPSSSVRKGIQYLENGQLEKGEKELQVARFAMPNDPIVKYNLGQVNYRKRNYLGAAAFFAESANLTDNEELRFKSLHNLGNASYRHGEYAAAIDAYKRGLEIHQDPKTEYNLKQAEEKLKQQMEQEQKDQKNQEKSQQDKQKDSQDKNQKKDSKGDSKDENSDQQKEGSDDKNSEQKDQENKDGKEKSDKNQSQSDKDGQQDKENSESEQKPGEEGKEEEQKRQDVEMAKPDEKDKKPEESQKARAIKNKKLNPYMVEKLMRELKEREKKGQLYYRNDPKRQEDLDPFEMDARQLQEFYRNRGRRKPDPKSEDPDW